MKITRQSIEWLGDNQVRISTTRSKKKSGSYLRLGWFSVSTPTSSRSSTVTDIIGMDRERFKIERNRIQRGRFRDYNPDRYYEYNEDSIYTIEGYLSKAAQKCGRAVLASVALIDQRAKKQKSADQTAYQNAWLIPITKLHFLLIGVTISWFFSFVLFIANYESIGSSLLALSWLGVPISLYLNGKQIRKQTNSWSPRLWLYVAGAFVPIFTGFVGLLYILNRIEHNRKVFKYRTDNN